MAKRLTDEQRKTIAADYCISQNYSEVARKHGISKTAVRNIVTADADSSEKFRQKAEENTQDVLAYMDSQRETKKRLIGKLLAAMEAKTENVDMFTSIKDLATAYGIILDKEFKFMDAAKESEKPEPVEIILRREE